MSELAKKLIVNPAGRLREPSPADKQVCPVCQITFLEFRNSGRLGCPYDYEVFRDELMPLAGEHPRRDPAFGQGSPAGAAEQPAADDLDPAPQRVEAGRRGRGLRGGRPGRATRSRRSSRSRAIASRVLDSAMLIRRSFEVVSG